MDKTTFFGLELSTLPGLVMTPRPASEQLVATVLDRIGDSAAVVADVGTGSGAVAVATAVAAPLAHVWATDTSTHAVQLAQNNARRHGVENRVTVREGDLLDPVPGPVDVIVANLPYLPVAEAGLHAGLEGEPEAAVFAAGDGLDHYRRLVASAYERLAAGGALVLQLRRRVLVAERSDLAPSLEGSDRAGWVPWLRGGRAPALQRHARRPDARRDRVCAPADDDHSGAAVASA